jgi:hypothetical protein
MKVSILHSFIRMIRINRLDIVMLFGTLFNASASVLNSDPVHIESLINTSIGAVGSHELSYFAVLLEIISLIIPEKKYVEPNSTERPFLL